MAEWMKYRGAGKVPVSHAKVEPGQQGKKDPLEDVWPRKDWINPGEHVPVTRHKSNIHNTPGRIPPRKKHGKGGLHRM